MPVKVLRVLMLHGHGQSGDDFEAKTRYVREIFGGLSKDLKFEFKYLSGLLPAYPDNYGDENFLFQRAWGYGEPDHGRINGLEKSLEHILSTLDQDDSFCGIIGFSSGAAMAAIITSLLEKRRETCNIPWKTRHPPLHFAICLSGFMLGKNCYQAFYDPKIETPIFHTIGELDATISTAQTIELSRQCTSPWFFEFNGGHYVPQIKEFINLRKSLSGFLEEVLGLPKKLDTSWIDIPFDEACYGH
ncbi:uncharacterized protein N7484_008208 [Penicillium longicatenatum]|uniref:uncharacterized protein n=1 Tax=Penicillium longicatenatum TaxID=1561947 RepID=UPI00254964C7|nr:uncharacterized protein N7484_008208 [Penicillium longicatenatum]KAJ5640346.1 hypothetical protein N7484_008208 [Penicillium longicatenatum]